MILQRFTINGTPLLTAGASTDLLAGTPNIWLHSKVYASGGENTLHAHSAEDHAFLVLSGSAKFMGDSNEELLLGPLDGVLIPRGTPYRFENITDRNLVVLRVGSHSGMDHEYHGGEIGAAAFERVGASGEDLPPRAKSNRTAAVDAVPHPTARFGAPNTQWGP